MLSEDYFERLREVFPSGKLVDASFDAVLPPLTRSKSFQFWTPLHVVNQVVEQFARHGCRRVLDVGSGPGKFCLGGGFAQPKLSFVGIEQRIALVDTAEELRRLLRLENVSFRLGDALAASWYGFDALYFFNPFTENRLAREATFDAPAAARARFRTELIRVAECLSRAPLGVVIATYHGLGGPIPSSYDLLAEHPVNGALLNVWRKTRTKEEDWVHVELHDQVERVPREHFVPSVTALPARSIEKTTNPASNRA